MLETTDIAFDKRSGQILHVYYNATYVKGSTVAAQYRTDYRGADGAIDDKHVAMITVPCNAVEHGKRYKVDITCNALVPTDANDGVGFGFGATTANLE